MSSGLKRGTASGRPSALETCGACSASVVGAEASDPDPACGHAEQVDQQHRQRPAEGVRLRLGAGEQHERDEEQHELDAGPSGIGQPVRRARRDPPAQTVAPTTGRATAATSESGARSERFQPPQAKAPSMASSARKRSTSRAAIGPEGRCPRSHSARPGPLGQAHQRTASTAKSAGACTPARSGRSRSSGGEVRAAGGGPALRGGGQPLGLCLLGVVARVHQRHRGPRSGLAGAVAAVSAMAAVMWVVSPGMSVLTGPGCASRATGPLPRVTARRSPTSGCDEQVNDRTTDGTAAEGGRPLVGRPPSGTSGTRSAQGHSASVTEPPRTATVSRTGPPPFS